MNETFDYPPSLQPRKQPYWLILFAAWIVSVPIVSALDQGMKSYLYGGSADGGATMLAMPAIIPAAITARFLKRRWWVAAILGGTCAPIAVVAMYLVLR